MYLKTTYEERELHVALKRGEIEGFRALLLEAGNTVDINKVGDSGWSLLRLACHQGIPEIVEMLLARPGIDVNATNPFCGRTAFDYASESSSFVKGGGGGCFRLLLDDPRTNLRLAGRISPPPVYTAAVGFKPVLIKVWIASGRELDLSPPSDEALWEGPAGISTDIVARTRLYQREPWVADLLEEFRRDPAATRFRVRQEIKWPKEDVAAGIFAHVVFLSDSLLEIRDPAASLSAASFFHVAGKLPQELQMILCLRAAGSMGVLIPCAAREREFKKLAACFA